MRARVRWAVAPVLAAALVACGNAAPTSKPGATTPAPTTTLSTAQLTSRLLGVDAVGAGWQVGSPINPADLSSFAQVPCEEVTLDPAVASRLTAATGIQFEPTDNSYKHIIELVAVGEPRQLASDLGALLGAIESCAGTASTKAANGMLKTLTIPALGEQRAAYIGSIAESPGSPTTWYVRFGFVRLGSVAVSLGLTEILATPQDEPHVSDSEYVQLLTAAVTRISG